MNVLTVSNLSVSIEDTSIVKNVSFEIQLSKTLYLMGPNGSGKSSTALGMLGYPGYEVTGSVTMNGQELLGLTPDKRAKAGLFLSMQNPPVVSGVTVTTLLKNSYQSLDGAGSILDFQKRLFAESDRLGVSRDFLRRNVNEGFSGGEKKRLELLQLAVLRPKIAILDEPDSGLDVDGIQLLAKELSRLQQEYEMSFIIITHYAHLVSELSADQVIVLKKGSIVAKGDQTIMERIQAEGFEAL